MKTRQSQLTDPSVNEIQIFFQEVLIRAHIFHHDNVSLHLVKFAIKFIQ